MAVFVALRAVGRVGLIYPSERKTALLTAATGRADLLDILLLFISMLLLIN
jgi:hypothetical protein